VTKVYSLLHIVQAGSEPHSASYPMSSLLFMVQSALYPGIKRPGLEAGHSSPFNAKVKNGGAILPLLHTS
jgi:hypothetical protein